MHCFESVTTIQTQHKIIKLMSSHESLVRSILIGLVGEVGHINHFEALAVFTDDITDCKCHDV